MENETFTEGIPQEERMDASSGKVLLQKILEFVEAQIEMLKKIVSHLSKMEDDELKKEEENKEDEVNHGQSKMTQEDINRMMIEGKVCLLLPNFMP